MPLLLAESAKLSNDMVQRGVIETIIEESPMLRAMPFLEVEGNSFKFNQENTLGGAQFYAVNGVWSEALGDVHPEDRQPGDPRRRRRRGQLRPAGAVEPERPAGDPDAAEGEGRRSEVGADRRLRATRRPTPNTFDGLDILLPKNVGHPQVITPAAGGGSLTLALLDQLIDLVKGGKPDLLLMSKRSRRKLKALLTASAHYVESGESAFGRQVMMYDGIPVLVSDFITDTEAADNGTGSHVQLDLRDPPVAGGWPGGADERRDRGDRRRAAGDEGRQPGQDPLVRGDGGAAGFGGGADERRRARA